jgi:hypothetical protein
MPTVWCVQAQRAGWLGPPLSPGRLTDSDTRRGQLWEFSEWILRAHPQDGIKIFTAPRCDCAAAQLLDGLLVTRRWPPSRRSRRAGQLMLNSDIVLSHLVS